MKHKKYTKTNIQESPTRSMMLKTGYQVKRLDIF